MSDKPTSKAPLEPKSDNPSQNSRLRAATDIQSSVTPEDYPAQDRQAHAELVGKTAGKKVATGPGERGKER